MFGKKPILLVFTLLAALSLHFFLSEKKITEANSSASDSFTEQWRLMKKPENRHALTQNSSNWHLHDQLQERAFKRKYFSAIEKVKFQGPKSVGGRTRDLIIDASNNNRYLAASVSGGIWVSENKGAKWQPVNDQGANLNATCIDQSPINNALVIYGTGEPQGNSSGAPGQGVFLSTDTGKTFAPILASVKAPGMDYIWEVKFDLKDENTFYVACSNGNLYRTSNLGNSFQKVYSAQNEITEIEVFESGKVMVAVNSVGILMSESGDSASFSILTKGLPANGFQRISITHCARFPEVVFAQFAQKKTSVGVYKSSNGGKTWQDMANPQGFRGDYSLAWYALVLEVSPFDTNFLMSGSVKLMYSVDGAKSWDVALRGHADQHSVVFNNEDSTHFLVGSDGGVHSYSTSTVKSKFQNLNGNYYSSQFFALGYGPSGNAFIGGTQDNGTHYYNITQDDEKYVLGGDGGYCHIHQQDTNLAYASTQEGGLEKSTNINSINPGFLPIIKDLDKNNDGQLDDGAWFITPFEMNYLNGDELYVVTKNKVWLSKNQGENWSQLINPRLNPYSVAISNQKTPEQVFIGGDGMLLLRVDNPNSHSPGDEINLRVNVPAGIANSFISDIEVHPNDKSIIFLTLSDYSNEPRIWRIDDADTDQPIWTNISGNLPVGLPCNSLVAHPDYAEEAMIVATDFGVYSTTNGGINWVKEKQIPNSVVYQLRLRKSDYKVFVGTHGRGIWTMNFLKNPPISTQSPEVLKLALYPNPATDVILIPETFIENGIVTIFDVNGKVMLNGEMNNRELVVSNYPTGFYGIQIESESRIYTGSFIKN